MTKAPIWTAADAAGYLSAPNTHSHKYSRGVLALRTGSSAFPGAAVLGAEAAWRTGIGLVCFVPQLGDAPPPHGLPTPAAAVLAARPETVVSAHPSRYDAWVVGSGTDPALRSPEEQAELRTLLAGEAPVIVDAGALDAALLRDRGEGAAAPAILTPHAGEFHRLCEALGVHVSDDPAEAATQLARRLSVTVLLKGSVTLVAAPSGRLLRVGPTTPWLATAGTGDVLAGALGALTAQHHATTGATTPDDLAHLGATAALLHDAAARIAAGTPRGIGEDAGHPITALDVAGALPDAVRTVRRL